MNRYHASSGHYAVAGDAGAHEYRDPRDRYDRASPLAVPEIGSGYEPYLAHAREDSEHPDDPYLALTTQSLNSDGTPKRPMNAFMVFARKRRPEISAANQMMRTGDISKILSKEWTSMDMSEKKFYLDQAKKLKDTFNAKYPDYVYRRRPNNSRKKRKTDSDQNSPQALSSSAEAEDLEDASPIDSDDAALHQADGTYNYSQVHASNDSAQYEAHSHFPPSSSGYQNDFASGQYGQQSRTSNIHSQGEGGFLSSGAPIAPLRLSPLNDNSTVPQGYSSHSSQHQSSLYVSQDPHSGHGLWSSSRETGRQDQGRWPVLPALDTNVSRHRTSNIIAMQVEKTEPYSPQLSHRSWSGSTPSSSSAATNYSNSAFPTLTSPFYPSQSPSQRSVNTAATSPSSHSQDYHASPSASAHMHRVLPLPGKPGEQGSFTQSGTLPLPSANAYMTQAQNVSGWQSQYRGGTNGAMPGAQRLSPPSLPGVTLPPPTPSFDGVSPGSAASQSQMTYWDRGRYEGR